VTDTALNFISPPIGEVAYSVQFEPLGQFHLGFIGLLWGERYRQDYPSIEHDEMLSHEIERFGAKNLNRLFPRFELLDSIPVPRIKMINPDSDRFIQIQKDRFVFNWRKAPGKDTVYPRYHTLKSMFSSELEKFESFVSANQLGFLKFNQIEITNVNYIPAETYSFSEVFNGLTCGTSLPCSDLKEETFAYQIRHVIYSEHKPIGRLYTNITKENKVSDGSEVFVLRLTARAHPVAQDRASAMDTLDALRAHINLSFDSFTSEKMHNLWGKENHK